MRNLSRLLLMLLPWTLRRSLLCWFFGYEIHPTAHIGWAWVGVERLVMGAHSKIGHLTVCKGLALLKMGEHSSIGRGNWITGFPADSTRHFVHDVGRQPTLVIGEHAAITNRHLIDCTNAVSLGAFSTMAGFRSQLLTHSIELYEGRQASRPVSIGRYCFVGTGCILLGGAVLPDRSVLGAGSVLRAALTESDTLYAGVPAKAVRRLEPGGKYFSRAVGFVD